MYCTVSLLCVICLPSRTLKMSACHPLGLMKHAKSFNMFDYFCIHNKFKSDQVKRGALFKVTTALPCNCKVWVWTEYHVKLKDGMYFRWNSSLQLWRSACLLLWGNWQQHHRAWLLQWCCGPGPVLQKEWFLKRIMKIIKRKELKSYKSSDTL